MNTRLSPLPSTVDHRSIGDILVAAGRLSADAAKRIVERQKLDNIPFGDAAIALQLLTRADIDFALGRQFEYAYLNDSDRSLNTDLVAAYQPFGKVSEDLRALRSQLMLRWFNVAAGNKVLSIVGPEQGDGRSFVAANLAIVFAQQGQRTLLIDGDLRGTHGRSQRELFHLGRSPGLSEILSGRASIEAAQPVQTMPGLSVLPSGAVPPNPQELLGRPAFGQLLTGAVSTFDVILIDTPCGNEFADAVVISAQAGAALMVTRRNRTLVPSAVQLARRLQEGGVVTLGAILNDA